MPTSSVSDPFTRFYEDAQRIHAICITSGFSTSDAKLFVYIHVRASQSPNGLDYFQTEDKSAILALNFLLGKSELNAQPIKHVPARIRQIDTEATQNGIEFPLRYELENRLRLHTDAEFRQKKLRTFREQILSQIPGFGLDHVRRVFEKNRENLSVIETRLNAILTR